MDCGISMIKYILFLFNTLCSICGILMVVFAGLLLNNVRNFDDFKDAVETQHVPISMIVLGSVVVMISFFGCCGAIRESYCMLTMYSAMLFLLIVLQLSLITYVWSQREHYLLFMGDVVERAWERRTVNADYMDAIEISLKCCGKNSYFDYVLQGYFPPSCCQDLNNCHLRTVYRKGCKKAFIEFWDRNSSIIIYAGLVTTAIEMVGFVFACSLAHSVRNFPRRMSYV